MKALIPISAVHYGVSSDAVSSLTFNRTRFELDPSWWPAGTVFYVEVSGGWNSNSSNDYDIELVRDDGASMASVTVPAGSGTSANVKRFARVSWTPTAGLNVYKFKLAQTAGLGDLGANVVHVFADVSGSGSARAFYQIAGRNGATSGTSTTASTLATSSTTYVTGGDRQGVFRRDDSKFGGTPVYRLYVNAGSSGTGRYALVRISTGATVVSSEVDSAGEAVVVSVEITADSEWVDGEDYEFVFKTVATNCRVYSAWITVDSPGSPFRCWHTLRHDWTAGGSDSEDGKALWSAAGYTLPAVSLVAAGKKGTAGNIQIGLGDDGTSDGPGSASSVVAGSLVDVDPSTKGVWESGALSLTEGNRHVAASSRSDSSTANVFVYLAVDVNPPQFSPVDSISPYETVDAGTLGFSWHSPEDSISPRESPAASLVDFQWHSPSDSVSPRESVAGGMLGYLHASPEDSMSPYEGLDSAVQQDYGDRMLVIAEIALSTGTKFVSSVDAAHPARLYRGRVTKWGRVDRSIPLVPGLPHIGDGEVEMADTDLEWAKLVGGSTPIGAEIKIKWGPEGGRESLFSTVYTGTVTGASSSPGLVRLSFMDKTWAFLDDEIPALATSENFSLYMDTGGGFAPIVLGVKDSSGLTDAGAVPCPRISATKWIAARHLCQSIDRVYKKAESEDGWTLVNALLWSVTTESKTIGGRTYTFTEIVTPDWEPGTMVRADVSGAVEDGVLLDNPADAVKWALKTFAGRTDADFDSAAWDTLSTALSALGWTISYMVTGDPDWRVFLGRVARSFNLDFRTDEQGRIWAGRSLDVDAARPVLDDTLHLLKFGQSTPKPINTWEYGYNELADGVYSVETFRNTDSVAAVGPREDQRVDLHAVGDADTAYAVSAERSLLMAEDAYETTFSVSGPRLHHAVRLSSQVGLTVFHGLDPSGALSNEPHRIISVSLDLDDLRMDARAVRLSTIAESRALLTGNWAYNSIPGPWRGPATGLLYGVFRKNGNGVGLQTLVLHRSADWGTTWETSEKSQGADIASFDTFARGNNLHVAVQETVTARVSYWRYNMASRTWEVENETVGTPAVVPPKANLFGVSVCETPGGDVWCMYAGGGVYDSKTWCRALARKRSSSGWGAETRIAPNDDRDNFMERAVPGSGNRAHFFWRDSPGTLAVAGNSMHRTWTGSAWGDGVPWINRVLGFAPHTHNMGRYHTYTHDDGTTRMLVPFKGWGGYAWGVEFTSADELERVYDSSDILDSIERVGDWVFGSEGTAHGSARAPQISMGRAIDSSGQDKARALVAEVPPRHETYKIQASPVWGPGDNLQKAGPSFSSLQPQSGSALFFRARGQIYIAKFFGIDGGVGFELVAEGSLPLAAGYDKAAFEALAGDYRT